MSYMMESNNIFLAKSNITYLYKEIVKNNRLYNISKDTKQDIIKNLIDNMKDVYKHINPEKVNQNNQKFILKQFNDKCLMLNESFLKEKHLVNEQPSLHREEQSKRIKDRNDIFTGQKNTPPPRPQSQYKPFDNNTPSQSFTDMFRQPSIGMEQMQSNRDISIEERMKQLEKDRNNYDPRMPVNSNDLPAPPTMSFNDRLQQLEKERRVERDAPPEMPDFLKPIETSTKKPMYDAPVSHNDAPTSTSYFNSDSNVATVNYNTPEFDPNETIEQRMARIEAERSQSLPVNNSAPPPSVQPSQPVNNMSNTPHVNNPPQQQYNQPVINPPQPQYNQPVNNPPQQQYNQPVNNPPQPQQQVKYLQLDIENTDPNYRFTFDKVNNVKEIKLINYYLPPQYYNFEYSELKYNINNTDKNIILNKGFYNDTTLLQHLNMNDDLEFILTPSRRLRITLKNNNRNSDSLVLPSYFKVYNNDFTSKLGFNNIDDRHTNNLVANNQIDYRPYQKLYFYLLNIDGNPFGVLNFNNNSRAEITFKKPINLDVLHFKFISPDGKDYDFDGLSYELCIQLTTIE